MTPSSRAHRAIAIAVSASLTACAQAPLTLPGPVNYPRSPAPTGLALGVEAASPQRPTETGISSMPSSPPELTRPASPSAVPTQAVSVGQNDEVSMAIEQTALPMFIQILYGNVLKKAYSLDQAVNARTDIVTFKTSQPISRAKLEEVATNLLRSYQLSVQDYGGVIRIVPESAASANNAPIVLRRGKTLPETPESQRPAFQHLELDVVRTTDISQWLRQILGNRVAILEDTTRNGFLMSGTQADLRLALDLVQSLDQPRLRGRVAKRITPAYMNANEFGTRLGDVLGAQGYAVANTPSNSAPVLIIPITAIGSVVVFTSTDAVMDQVVRWARELDRPLTVQTQNGIYTYAVKYADAQELAKTLGEILTGSGGISGTTPLQSVGNPPGGAVAAQTPMAQVQRTTTTGGGRVVVNSATNTLIIRGTTPEEYQQIMALLRELDRPVKSALIEVVVAELRLGGSQSLGIEWNLNPQTSSRGSVQGGTLGRLGIGSGGFTLGFANSAGQIVGLLNTLASNNKARILSNPKVLARNGETASIQVGQEVPIVSSQQSSGAGGLFGNTGGVLQTIQYRSTGVILRVRPVINAGNRLDLEVSQEVSSAAETRTGVSASPTISTRRIETKLSLRDGSTVLLGGLISRSTSDANTGVPYLKDIPGLGALFRTASDSNDQTELLIMITPYVVSDDFESEAITEAIQKTFGEWAQDIRPSRVMTPQAIPLVQPAPAGAPASPLLPAPQRPAAPPPLVEPPAPRRADPATEPAAAPLTAPPPAPVPVAPAGDNKPAPTVQNDGITMSRPPGQAVPPASAAPAASAASAPARPASGPVLAPPPGRVVTDPKVKKEIEELLKNRRP